jgi:hypothetical protein
MKPARNRSAGRDIPRGTRTAGTPAPSSRYTQERTGSRRRGRMAGRLVPGVRSPASAPHRPRESACGYAHGALTSESAAFIRTANESVRNFSTAYGEFRTRQDGLRPFAAKSSMFLEHARTLAPGIALAARSTSTTCFEQLYSRLYWRWQRGRTPCFSVRCRVSPSRPTRPHVSTTRIWRRLQRWRVTSTAGPWCSIRLHSSSRRSVAARPLHVGRFTSSFPP